MTRSRSLTYLASATALVIAAVAAAGCGSGGGSNAGGTPAPPKTANGQSATVGVANEKLGKVLVNSEGFTLYLFQRDSGTTSACTGACATFWPPVRAKGKPTVGSGASPSLLATITRSDGGTQLTYNKHPLYLYSGDQKPGDTKGEGLTAFGGSWFALTPAGGQVSGQASNPAGSGY
jgi:predicted lipoprotein with Yx(FWY)xxD motif